MIYVIMGASGSGKTSLAEEFVRLNVSRVRTNTTRAKRPDESSDAYNFLSREEFQAKISAGLMLEFEEYGGNLYGVSVDSISDNCVIVLEPKGYNTLKGLFGDKVVGIWLIVSAEERIRRGCLRQGINSVMERFVEDSLLFDSYFLHGGSEKKVDYILSDKSMEYSIDFITTLVNSSK